MCSVTAGDGWVSLYKFIIFITSTDATPASKAASTSAWVIPSSALIEAEPAANPSEYAEIKLLLYVELKLLKLD